MPLRCIDLVVEGGGGKRVAIQCDGDRHQAMEDLPEVMERQLTLERLGWTFIRIRASEFIRDPETGLKKLFARLKALAIDAIGPATPEETAATNRGKELKEKVLKRAEQIRRAWKDIPDAPAPPKTNPGESQEVGEDDDEESRQAA